MQTTLNRLTSPVRSFVTGPSGILFAVLAVCLGAVPAMAATAPPIVVTGPSVLIGDMQFNGAGGGWFSGQAPLGGTFVVGVNGDVIVGDGYGKGVFQITPAGVQTVLATLNNSNAAGMDQYGNAYIAHDYGAAIYKLPYNAATGQYVGYTTTPTANCLGGTQDTAACVFAPGTQAVISAGATAGGGNPGFTSLFFDGQGNFFFVTDTNPGNTNGGNANTIYECSAQCQAETDGAGTYPPVVVYADTQPIGVVSIDPWGNLFFSDGYTNGADTGKVSNVQELPLVSGKYASTPTLVTSYTTSASYNGISGVVASNLGTVYFAVANDGVFAIPNSSSGPNSAGIYKVSTLGGKGLTMDTAGNIYLVQYSGTLSHDGVFTTPMGNIGFGASPVGTAAATVATTVIDSAANCTTPPTLTFTDSEGGAATTEFTTTPGTSCSTVIGTSQGTFSTTFASTGASYTATLGFTPIQAGKRTAALVIGDSTNSASGMTALNGVGTGAAANLDPGVSTAYTTGFTSPASVVGDAAGDIFVADSGAGKVFEVAKGSTTPTAIGSGFMTPDALAFDANGDLFIADDGMLEVEEIPNTGTTGAFAAGTQTTVIGTTALFGGKALGSATGLAVGPNGTLYVSDPANKRVVSYNLITGKSGVTLAFAGYGISSPEGLAVDSTNDLLVADSALNEIFEFSPATGVSTIKPPNVTAAVGVAVDGSGSVLVADAATGNIVRIPSLSGTLTTAQAVTIETVGSQASSLWMDLAGDLFVASASGKTAYAIQRTAASVNLGTVQDGLTNSLNVSLMNAGNAAATLGSPAETEPTNTMFTLASAATNGCTSGGSGPAGSLCQFTATFAPAVGTANGVQTGTGTINIATPAVALTVNLSGTATQSSILAQTITGFNPPPTLLAGQQITLSATGGASGNPVVFSIDPASTCTSCATTTGTNGATLTAVGAGKVIVDANQAGGTNNGNQYAAAKQVQATITISSATPAGVPGLVMNQVTWLNPTGSFTDGQNPQGGSFALTQNGEIVVGTSYSNKVYVVNAQTGATIGTPVTVNGPGGITVDSNNNLYISHLYNNIIYKVPFVKGAYVSWSDNPTPAPPACTGSDTAECTFVTYPSGAPNSGGLKAIAFDPSGNFYMVSEPSTATGNLTGSSNIYECNTSCQPAGTGTVLYADTNGVSQIAFDPWGNLFFTDANYDEASANDVGNSGASSSSLNELVYTSGTGFASTPTVLQTFTNKTAGNYDDMLASVAVNPSGTIYYGVLYDGMFAIPNTKSGGPQVADQYAVSSQGAKALEADTLGNLYLVANTSGADTVGFLAIGDLTTPNAQYQGAPVNASATVVDNAYGCGTAATLLFTSSNPTEFSATAGTTCTSIGMGDATLLNAVPNISSYAATITFTPLQPNTQTATLTASDTANGGVGTATVTGLAQTTPQTISFTAPANNSTYTYSAPPSPLTVAVTVANGPSNNPVAFTVDSSSTGAGTFSSTTVSGTNSTATLTVTQAGSIVIDANEAGGLVKGVYYQAAPQVQLSITVNPAAQTIVFPQPTTPLTYSPTLTASLSANGGGSGNAVTFSVDAASTGAGSISPSVVSNGTSTATLTVTQAGNIVIDANQAGSVNYAAATQVQQTIVVNQASQTITFNPLTNPSPFHYIAACTTNSLCATVTFQATGGGSNNVITLTADPKSAVKWQAVGTPTVSGATTTATVLLPPGQTLTFPANLIIDLNQASTSNYAAAPQLAITIPVQAPLPTQTITFSQPQTQVAGTSSKPSTLALVATSSSGFPVTFTSSTTSVCTVSGSTATFLPSVTATSACTITAAQPGDNQYFAAAVPVSVTFAVNPAGQTPALNMSLSQSSLTIEPGTVGVTQITLGSANNFAAGQITLSCSGVPSGSTCNFNPSTVTSFAPSSTTGLPGGPIATSTLQVTTQLTGALVRPNFRPLFPAALALVFCFLGIKKRNRLQMFLLLVVIFAGLGMITSCGGSSSSSTPTPSTSQITITATGGGATITSTLSVTVE